MDIPLAKRVQQFIFISLRGFHGDLLPVRLHEVLLDPEDLVALHLLLVPLGPTSIASIVLQAYVLAAALLPLPLVAVVLLNESVRVNLLNRPLTLRLLLPL